MNSIRFAAAISGLVLSIGTASAGVVRLNVNVDDYEFGETKTLVRYRVSQTNWDQIIATSSSISTSTIVQQANLGNNTQLRDTVWDFNLTFTKNVGYTWTLNKVSGNSPVSTSTVSWTAPKNGNDPLRAVNAIRFYAEAGSEMPSGIASARIDVTDLAFNASGFTNIGSLVDIFDAWDDVPPFGDGQDADLPLQALVADSDLSQTDWSFTGRVVATYTLKDGFSNPGGNLDERLKLDVKIGEAIPAPGAAALAGLAALAALRRRR